MAEEWRKQLLSEDLQISETLEGPMVTQVGREKQLMVCPLDMEKKNPMKCLKTLDHKLLLDQEACTECVKVYEGQVCRLWVDKSAQTVSR